MPKKICFFGISLLAMAALVLPNANSAEPAKDVSSATENTHGSAVNPAHSSNAVHTGATANAATETHSAPVHPSTHPAHPSVPAHPFGHTVSIPEHFTDPVNSTECKISLVDPHIACGESQKVLDVLHKLVKAYSTGDMKTYEEYLDEHCTTFDENTKKLVSGKASVIADIEHRVHQFSADGPTPLKAFTIDQPYARVEGDTAVVTFVAFREIGGKHPAKEKCHVTDVFVKRGDTWKKLHFRGSWKKA